MFWGESQSGYFPRGKTINIRIWHYGDQVYKNRLDTSACSIIPYFYQFPHFQPIYFFIFLCTSRKDFWFLLKKWLFLLSSRYCNETHSRGLSVAQESDIENYLPSLFQSNIMCAGRINQLGHNCIVSSTPRKSILKIFLFIIFVYKCSIFWQRRLAWNNSLASGEIVWS